MMPTEREIRLVLEGILLGMMILWLIECRLSYKNTREQNKILENIKKYDEKKKAEQQQSKVSNKGQKRKRSTKKNINV